MSKEEIGVNIMDDIFNNPKGTPLKYDNFKKYEIASFSPRTMEIYV